MALDKEALVIATVGETSAKVAGKATTNGGNPSGGHEQKDSGSGPGLERRELGPKRMST